MTALRKFSKIVMNPQRKKPDLYHFVSSVIFSLKSCRPSLRQRKRSHDERPLLRGAIAQLGERLNGIQEVRGSTPLAPPRGLFLPRPLSMIFYNVPVSNFGLRVRLAFDAKGLDVEERLPPDGYGSAAYKAIVPAGSIPAIVDGVFTLSESAVIVEWLEEKFPAPALLTGNDQQRAMIRWLDRLHDTRIEPCLRATFRHMAPVGRDEAFVIAQFRLFTERLALIEPRLKECAYLSGAQPGMADLAYPGTLLLAKKMAAFCNLPFTLKPEIAAYLVKMQGHDVFAESLRNYAKNVDEWLASKS